MESVRLTERLQFLIQDTGKINDRVCACVNYECVY